MIQKLLEGIHSEERWSTPIHALSDPIPAPRREKYIGLYKEKLSLKDRWMGESYEGPIFVHLISHSSPLCREQTTKTFFGRGRGSIPLQIRTNKENTGRDS